MADTTTQTIRQETALPEWYTSYLQNVMGRAVGTAGEEYQPYGGPRVAGLTGDQQSAYDLVRNLQGGQTGTLQNSLGLFNQAGANNSGAAGAGSFGSAGDYFNQGAGANTAGISNPYVQQGTALANQSAGGSSLAAANPYIQQSVAPTGLQAASPFLGAAAQSFPGAAQSYMNPYNDLVTNRIAELGGRNLSENLLPQISDQFVRAGQYGSPQQREGVYRALRDTQESVLGQQAQVLQQGYGQAGQLFGQDQARLAGLAGTAGGLGQGQQQLLQSAGLGQGSLAGQDLSRILSAGQTVGQLGLGQAGVAGSDASRQIAAGQGMAGIGQSQIQASQTDNAQRLGAAQGILGLAGQAQNMGFQQAGALEGIGAAQQGQNQQNLNTGYQDYLTQQQYPWQQIGNLSNVIQGVPVNQSSSSNVQTTNPSPSTLSQIGGIGLGVAGLANSGIFKARGGRVDKKDVKFKRAHSYGNTPKRGIAFMDEAA